MTNKERDTLLELIEDYGEAREQDGSDYMMGNMIGSESDNKLDLIKGFLFMEVKDA